MYLALIQKEHCILTCVKDCVGTLRSANSTLEQCECKCHENDHEDLNEEQEVWLEMRMHSPMGEPWKSWSVGKQ